MPAFIEFPIIRVVHPAYQAEPNGGQGSFLLSGSLRLSCDLVFATAHRQISIDLDTLLSFMGRTFGGICNRWIGGLLVNNLFKNCCFKAYVPISTPPAVDPAIIDRSALGYKANKTKVKESLSYRRLAFSLRPSDIVLRDPELLE